MVSRFFEILENNEKDFEPQDVGLLLQLIEKYPEFKVIYAILRNFPVDVFKMQYWNKAEINDLNFKDLYKMYSASDYQKYKDISEKRTFKKYKSLQEKRIYQKEILTNYLK